MLTHLPAILRLTFFLLFSLVLHGGLVFHDWMSEPGGSSVVAVPVSVALLPATKAPQQRVKSEPEKVPVPPPSPKPAHPVVKPKAATPQKTMKKAMIKQPQDAVVVEKVAVDSSAPEPVCMTSQDVVTESSSVAVAVNSAPAEENVVLASLAGSDVQTVDERPSFTSPAQVEAVPRYRSNPLPEYPRLARRKHWQGVVWLLVDVSPDGLVDDLQVEDSCGHKLLDRAAERTVKRWQFSPATRGGLPVSSQVRIPVRFRLEDS